MAHLQGITWWIWAHDRPRRYSRPVDTDPASQAARLVEILRTYPGGNAGLAEDLGVTASQVSRWRNQRARLSWERAVQVGEVTNVSPGWIFAGVDGWLPPHLAEDDAGRPRTSYEALMEQAVRQERRIERLEHAVDELQRKVLDRSDGLTERGPDELRLD